MARTTSTCTSWGPWGNWWGSSGGISSAEQVNLENPAPGIYTVVVHAFETDGPDANYTLFSWALADVAEGNLQVSGPQPATGPSGTVTVSWSGLLPGRRYLGAVSYSDGTTEIVTDAHQPQTLRDRFSEARASSVAVRVVVDLIVRGSSQRNTEGAVL